MDKSEPGELGSPSCGEYSALAPLSGANNVKHPEIERPTCEARLGCTWESRS